MKKTLVTLMTLAFAASMFAGEPVRRTIVIKDGQVFADGKLLDGKLFDGTLLGGKRPYLGIQLIDLTDGLRQHYGAPSNSGILIGEVEKGSPAEKAGLRVGDIVLSIDGQITESSSDIRKAMQEKKEGDSARVEVLRGSSRQTFVATVAEKESRIMRPIDLQALTGRLGSLDSPEWRARLETLGDCGSLQSRIKELETRLKDLEKKLQK